MTSKDGYNEILKNLQGCERPLTKARVNAETYGLDAPMKRKIARLSFMVLGVYKELREAMEKADGQPEEFDRKEEGTATEQV